MSKGYVPYMILYVPMGTETTITHTCGDDETEIKVYFERPDDEYSFKYLELKLFNLEIIKHHGFTDDEIIELLEFSKNNYDLIMEYSKVGGVENALG